MTRPTPAGSAALATALLLLAITALGLPLRTDAAPLGIASLQLAPDVDAAAAVLASWSGVPRSRLLWAHGLDVLLPFAYAAAIGLAARRRGARSALVITVLAALADQVENLAMTVTILSGPTTMLVRVTLLAAVIKWASLALALVLLGRSVIGPRPAVASA